ncbi:hypothetical protein Fcan01_26591 [Folsomia candida]|uniref:Uncharacterized protein n=1 Tax=Folsomia candida TaxID=158441 RepID=A0A226D225_FOLCA|nr:hypothetical protein Fcan01_26591 [Folsomia candida]
MAKTTPKIIPKNANVLQVDSSVWKVLDRLQKVLDKFWQLPVKISGHELKIVPNSAMTGYFLAAGSMTFIWILTVLLCYKVILFSDPDFIPLTAVVSTLILSDCGSALTITYSLFVNRSDVVFAVRAANSIMDDIPDGRPRKISPLDIRTILADGVLNSLLAFPAFGLLVPFVNGECAPYFYLFRHFSLPFPISECISALIYFQLMLQTSFVTAFFLLYVMICLEFLNQGLQCIALGASFCERNSKTKFTQSKWAKSKLTPVTFAKSLKIHRKISIILQLLNIISLFPAPALMGIVLCLGAVFIYGTISLYHVFNNPLLYLVGPMMLISIFVGCAAIFPELVNINLYSEEWIRTSGRKLVSKEGRRVVRSIRPLRVMLGDFYFFKRSVIIDVLGIVMYHGVTLVLAVK